MVRAIASVAAALFLSALAVAGPAAADWSGDKKPDILAVGSDGALLMYRTNGAGAFTPGGGVTIGGGWGAFTAVIAPGDWSGDGAPDILARQSDGTLLMYRGDGDGGWITGGGEPVGSGWQPFTALLTPGDFSGDGKPDILARNPDGALLLYRGNGAGGFAGPGQTIGAGWQSFTALFAGGDFSGDGKPDLIARDPDGKLLLYRGNGAGGFDGGAQTIGAGWQSFTAVFGGGDFNGDLKPDIVARDANGALLLYRGNAAAGFITGNAEQVGAGWQTLSSLMLLTDRPPPPPPPPPPAPPSAPLKDGRVKLTAGIRCTPPGGRLKVSLRIRRRAGHKAVRVRRVVFFIHNGPRRIDRKAPYVVRLRLNRPAGARGRVYARVVFRRAGEAKLRRKTVSRRFVICG